MPLNARFLAIAVALAVPFVGAPGLAKGLDELSENNPESAEGEAGTTAKAAIPPSELSKSLDGNLWTSTSAGWLIASKSKGSWKSGGGMSDLAVGYKVAPLGDNMNIFGTYRYAPMAVSGVEDDHSYRGVWEAHYFGARLRMNLGPNLTVSGSGELGYVLVHVAPTDGLEEEAKHGTNGVSVAIGGGADWHLFEKGALAIGPRLYLGFGSFSTVQIAGAATFTF